jgi:hypothetical protein
VTRRARPAWRAAARLLGGSLAVALSGSGCFRYAPIPIESVRPGEDVQVRLTDAAAARLAGEFGAYSQRLEGPLATEGRDSLSISLMVGREYNGMALEGVRQTLFLGRSEVVEVRRRELSRSRTAMAGAGALVVFALVVNAVTQMGDDNPTAGEQPPPPPPPGLRTARVGARLPFR